MNSAILLLCFVSTVSAFYDSHSEVVDLTPANFNALVINSDEVWVVEFYAPWCGHCQSLVPEYERAAKALHGVVKVGAVNADQHQSLGGNYAVKGFPTIKIFGANKNSPEDFNGQRTAQGIVDAALKAAKLKVEEKLSGKKSKSGSSKSGKSTDDQGGDVIELTDANFDDLVLKSDDLWLVEFFAPWCGHCKNLAPQWSSAAKELRGKAKLGALDATVHTLMAGRYGVRGYPTIKYFPAGKKDSAGEEFDGGRTSSDIVRWATDKLTESVPAPEINQITKNEDLAAACSEHQLCIVAVLPHILDCQSKCRKDYIDILTKLGEKFKKNMWGWLWVEGASQLELEESLGIGGFGYPAMAAMNARKMKYALLRGSFSYDGINDFLKELAFGRGSTMPVKGDQLPKIVESEAWDGKDGKLELDEEEYENLDEENTKEEL